MWYVAWGGGGGGRLVAVMTVSGFCVVSCSGVGTVS